MPRVVVRLAVTLPTVGLLGASVFTWTHRDSIGAWVLMLVFAVAFEVSERLTLHLDFRDQSVSTALTELPMTVAFFVLAPAELLLVRILSGVSSKLSRNPHKVGVNIGMLSVQTLVAVLVIDTLGGAMDIQEPVTWGVVGLAAGLPLAIDMLLLGTVVRAATGGRSRLGVANVVVLSGVNAALTSVTLAGILLFDVAPYALVLLVPPVLALTVGFRWGLRAHREANRLRTLYELASSLSRMPALDETLADVVTEARVGLRCEYVELVLTAGGPGGDDLVVGADSAGELTTSSRRSGHIGELAASADTWTSASSAGDGLTTPDEIAVPVLSGEDLLGTLCVAGRPGPRDPFGPTDAGALRTLAGQLGAVVGRGQLTSQLRTAAEARDYLESHDVLTGLGNRRWFTAELSELADEPGVTVALLNLRGFRRLNESLGQAAGDRLLVEVGDRLRAVAPAGAAVARLGGDDFALAVPGARPFDVEAAIGTAIETRLRGQEIVLPIAAGVVHRPDDVEGHAGLLRRADLALTVARRHRRGAVVRYDDGLEASVARRLELGRDLRVAIASGTLDVHFQPLVAVADGRTVGVEALARWTHPVHGRVGPDEFISIAEEQGDVAGITAHVIDVSCRQAAAWAAAGTPLEVSVNISAQDLDDGSVVEVARSALQRHGVPPSRLMLEITETAMMEDRQRAAATLAELTALGVGVAIDDFGTGHSSLAYLHDLSVTEIKVDRVFVADLTTSEESELIVTTVVELAARRRLLVVAEGVEDEATLQRLRELGVDRAQGWHTGRPVPASELQLGATVV